MTGSRRGRLRQDSFSPRQLRSGRLPPSLSAPQARADAREALQKAVVLAQEGRLDEADRQAQLALSSPQTRAVAYSVLGAIRFQQKRLPESVSLLEKAIHLDPRLLGAHLSLAEVYSVQGKSEEALAVYRRVLTLDTTNVSGKACAGAVGDREGKLSPVAGSGAVLLYRR